MFVCCKSLTSCLADILSPISTTQTQVKSSKKLISTDDKSNISNYKFTNLVEICTLCKDDLLFLPKKLARHIGNISRLVLVKNISNVINVIDPLTGQTGNIESDAYWRDPFRPIITAARTRLTRYVILGKDPIYLERNMSKKNVARKQRSKLALITAARESDLGTNDSQLEEASHLGYLMKSGDVCLGYDLRDCQVVDDDAEAARSSGKFPNVVFVRKLYGSVATGEMDDVSKKRMFKLQRLDIKKGEEEEMKKGGKKMRHDVEMDRMDEEDFMQELEADRDMRTRVNIYKSEIAVSRDKKDVVDGENGNEDDEDDEDDDQKITLDELLDNLILDSKPDAGDDAAMQGTVDDTAVRTLVGEVPTAVDGMVLIGEGERAAKDNLGYVGRDEALNIQQKDTAVVVQTLGKEFSTDQDGK